MTMSDLLSCLDLVSCRFLVAAWQSLCFGFVMILLFDSTCAIP